MRLLDYNITTTSVPSKPGCWAVTLCEIYKNGNKIGEYSRGYPSFSKDTFFPFSKDGQDYALYSQDYNTLYIMTLPDCKRIDLNPECIKQLQNYCPIELFIPIMGIPKGDKFHEHIGEDWVSKDFEDYTDIKYSNIGFALGCVWGDDSSMKLNLIDLSNIEKGELWYVNNKLEKEWLYAEFPDECKLKNIKCDFFESKLSSYDQTTVTQIGLPNV